MRFRSAAIPSSGIDRDGKARERPSPDSTMPDRPVVKAVDPSIAEQGALREAIGWASFDKRGEALDERLKSYISRGAVFFVVSHDTGAVIDGIAVAISGVAGTELVNIGVREGMRGRGFGVALVRAVAGSRPGLSLEAETDDDAVDFYRRVGFQVETLPPKPGWPVRYRCILSALQPSV